MAAATTTTATTTTTTTTTTTKTTATTMMAIVHLSWPPMRTKELNSNFEFFNQCCCYCTKYFTTFTLKIVYCICASTNLYLCFYKLVFVLQCACICDSIYLYLCVLDVGIRDASRTNPSTRPNTFLVNLSNRGCR